MIGVRTTPIGEVYRSKSLRDADVVVQELRSEIRSVRPHKSTEFLVYTKLLENGRIAQGLEDRAVQFLFQIDLAGRAIAKSKPDHESADVACLDNVVVHGHSRGAIRFRDSLLRARAQFSRNSSLCRVAHSSVTVSVDESNS